MAAGEGWQGRAARAQGWAAAQQPTGPRTAGRLPPQPASTLPPPPSHRRASTTAATLTTVQVAHGMAAGEGWQGWAARAQGWAAAQQPTGPRTAGRLPPQPASTLPPPPSHRRASTTAATLTTVQVAHGMAAGEGWQGWAARAQGWAALAPLPTGPRPSPRPAPRPFHHPATTHPASSTAATPSTLQVDCARVAGQWWQGSPAAWQGWTGLAAPRRPPPLGPAPCPTAPGHHPAPPCLPPQLPAPPPREGWERHGTAAQCVAWPWGGRRGHAPPPRRGAAPPARASARVPRPARPALPPASLPPALPCLGAAGWAWGRAVLGRGWAAGGRVWKSRMVGAPAPCPPQRRQVLGRPMGGPATDCRV